uniref:Phosphatidylinositol 3-kinase catalytic subunit type 3 n=1 Tax=Ciona savignyi TaxID=51511 RepID=H2YNJ3_CIOSA
APIPNRFHYVYSCDLDVNITIKICSLEGSRPKRKFQELLDDPYLKFSDSGEIEQEQDSHMYATVQIFDDNNPICLPVQTAYRHYTTSAGRSLHSWNEWLRLPVRFSELPRHAVATVTVWDTHGPGKALPVGGSTIPLFGKYGTFKKGRHDICIWPDVVADGRTPTSTPYKAPPHASKQMTRLAKLTKKHREGHMTKVDWLDRLTFSLMLEVHFPQFSHLRDKPALPSRLDRLLNLTTNPEKSRNKILCILWWNSQLWFAKTLIIPSFTSRRMGESQCSCIPYLPIPPPQVRTNPQLVVVPDHELLASNIIEEKHHKLARSLRTGQHDLKPNAVVRDQLMSIVSYPISKNLSEEDEDLVWKFRYYLMHQKKALTKFLRCVTWERPQERSVALQMLEKWAPIDVVDALELLSPRFQNPTGLLINNMAFQDICGSSKSEVTTSQTDGLDLATFLIQRACRNSYLANYFYWCVVFELMGRVSNMWLQSSMRLLTFFAYHLPNTLRLTSDPYNRAQLAGQQKFLDVLVKLMQLVERDSGNRKKKIEKLRAMLSAESESLENMKFSSFEPLPLPLDPGVKVNGIEAVQATLFKSNLMPAKLPFKTTDGKLYITIFKHGDDLRQDQLILQIITLMDKLLQKENLDLKLMPYKVLATSSKHGFVQYIESHSVAEVLATEGSIQNFFRKHQPNDKATYGIDPDVMDTYVKSCAGYCVITYLLGVGDRHLDNLLLRKTGALFHIDFGYILGRDPKPLPPPMKLSKEMVEAMGGVNSDHYHEFRKHCYTAFLHLRRHANLILNLFSLMTDASVPDIALEPDKTVKKVQDKFLLELTDEEAVRNMQALIDESVSALFPAFVEQIHKFAQTWRK